MKYLSALLALWAFGILAAIFASWLDRPTDSRRPPVPPAPPAPPAPTGSDGFTGYSVSAPTLCDWAEARADLLLEQQKES